MSTTKSLDEQLKKIKSKLASDVQEVLQSNVAPAIIQEEIDVADDLIYNAPYEPKTYKRRHSFQDLNNYKVSVNAEGQGYRLDVDFVAEANEDLYTPDGKIHLKRKSKHTGDYLLPILEDADYVDFPNAEGDWKEPKPIREMTIERLAASDKLRKQIIKNLKDKGWNAK